VVQRRIPKYIGTQPIPETRTITIQLLSCWGELLDEYKNIESLYNELKRPSPTAVFVGQAQDIAMHLAIVSDEKKVIAKRKDMIYVGEPKTQLGFINCKVAGILHRFFDEPDYVIKGKHRPIIRDSSDAKQAMEDCCPEEKKEIKA
jgi:hypothetical protein